MRYNNLNALSCRGAWEIREITIRYILENYPNKRVYLAGTELLESSFRDAGIYPVDKHPDLVVAEMIDGL